jgi:hypothetical protein
LNESFAQQHLSDVVETPIEITQQLEDLTESDEDMESEDDSYLQSLQQFTRNPINLNYTDGGQLQQLYLLSPLQISNLFSYRKLMGNLISIYELQAIPGWDVELIRKLRPYVTVSEKQTILKSLNSRLKEGNHTILIRSSYILEKSRGYLLDSSTAKSYYPGSGQKILFRYKYNYRNQLIYGITAEKDAGEQFFRGAQKNGFDFYSAHFFVRNSGIIKSLALGDFAVNLGQGLVQWQSLAFKKGSNILNLKRQSDVLRPYNSAGEIIYNRGAGITLKKNNWETTGFVSYRKLDAGFNVDTLNEEFVSSLRSSGYHRTANEIAGKNFQGQLSFGGNLNYSDDRFQAGVNAVHYNFDHHINKVDYLYNKYSISGKTAGNYSVDYSYTFKNMHFLGEAATDEGLDKAFLSGLLISTDSRVDMSFLYRNISSGYQSLYTNAFTKNSTPTNESGFYSGISINPVDYLRIDAYADFYHFPWLKYRTDAPTSGNDYMVQLTYKPNKLVEVSTRYRTENKAINFNPDELTLNPVIGKIKQTLRTQFIYKLDKTFTIRSRTELLWFDKRGEDPQNGFLLYGDILYKPLLKPFSANMRLMYFETDDYNSRLYTFENDVLYGYSIPVFFGKGFRLYANFNLDITRKISVWGRIAQTVYADIDEIGSGLDKIKGNKKTELKIQVIYAF